MRPNEPLCSTLDTLIDRVTDSSASPADWLALAIHAQTDEQVWEQVCTAYKIQHATNTLAQQSLLSAGRVDLPREEHIRPVLIRPQNRRRLAPVLPWAGWVAAVIMIIVSVTFTRFDSATHESRSESRSESPHVVISTDEALARYVSLGVEEGRILRELPLLTVEARALPGESQMEVVYVRQFVERTLVDDEHVFKLTSDENGRPVRVPADVITSDSGRGSV